jgi:hypothetical protein
MSILGNTGYEEFNRLLREWRRAGKKISWPELAEAYKLAQEAEAREAPDDREADQSRDAGPWSHPPPVPLYKGKCDRCGKAFSTPSETRKWCSDRCCNAAKQKRYRARKAEARERESSES